MMTPHTHDETLLIHMRVAFAIPVAEGGDTRGVDITQPFPARLSRCTEWVHAKRCCDRFKMVAVSTMRRGSGFEF